VGNESNNHTLIIVIFVTEFSCSYYLSIITKKEPMENETTKNFNDAFYLLNSKNTKNDGINYLSKIEEDSYFLHSYSFEAISESDYKKAIELLTKVIEKEKTNKHALNLRGIAYMMLKLEDEACSDFYNCRMIDEAYAPVYHSLGVHRSSIRREETSAITFFSDALKLNPKMYKSRYNITAVHIKIGEWKLAFDNLSVFLKDYPDYSKGKELMEIVKTELENIRDQKSKLNEEILKDPSNIELYEKRALVSKKLNKIGEMHDDMHSIMEYTFEKRRRRRNPSGEKNIRKISVRHAANSYSLFLSNYKNRTAENEKIKGNVEIKRIL
jgi:tetratricopeptide (TPR) repeat protein